MSSYHSGPSCFTYLECLFDDLTYAFDGGFITISRDLGVTELRHIAYTLLMALRS